jgi:predicted DNA-binding protein with PD1-like motif
MKIVRKGSLLTIGLEPDELLLESIQAAIDRERVRDGVVLSGIGTLKTCTLHAITGAGLPARDELFTLTGALELLSVSGIIAGGEPHLHAVVSERENAAQGGHIEPGCRVAYLAEIAILCCNEMPMIRQTDERGLKLLQRAKG